MQQINRLFVLIIFASYSWLSLIGQSLSINRLSVSQSDLDFIYDMRINSSGDLLIASDNSLYHFDGFNFRQLDIQHGSLAPITTAIEQGDYSELIGHYNGYISSINTSKGIKNSLKSKIVGIVSQADKHFVFSQDGEYLELDKGFNQILLTSLKKRTTVYEVIAYNQKIYLSTSDGLLIFDTDENGKLRLINALFEDKKVEAMAISQERLIAVIDNLVFQISTDDWSLTPISLAKLKGRIKTIVVVKDRLVVGSTVGVYDYRLYGTVAYISGYVDSYEQEDFPITKLYLSPNGVIYAGTYGLGLWAIPSSTFYFLSNERLTNRKISSIEIIENSILVVGGQSGIDFYRNGLLINELYPSASFLDNKKVNVVKRYSNGILIGTESNGLWFLDGDKRLTLFAEHIQSIQDIATDSIGGIWLSTSFEGLYTIYKNNVIHFSERSKFSRNDLSKIELVKDRLWFINGDDGFGYVRLVDSLLVIPSNLPPVKVMDFEVASNNVVWSSTQGDGVMSYNESGYSFIDLSEMLGNNYTNSIVVDSSQMVWLTNQNELIKCDRYGRVMSTDLGLYFESTFRAGVSYISDATNWIYYGTEEGLIYFDASSSRFDSLPSFSYSINSNKVDQQDEAIQLPFSDKLSFVFHYSDIVGSPFLDFSYRLKGMDSDWVPIEGNEFDLLGIGHGVFDLEVKAATKDGVVHLSDTIRLIIRKPFWLQVWFYVLLLFCAVTGVYLYTQFKIKRLRDRNIELKKIVSMRTKEITQKNKKLEQFAYAVSHDLKNPVVNLVGLVEILEQMDLFKDDHPRQVFDMLGTSSRQLDRLVKGLMELLKVQHNEAAVTTNIISELFNEIKHAISLQITKSNASIIEDFTNAPNCVYNRTYLYSILYNLTSNAVKYRDENRPLVIKVKTYEKDDHFVFEIEDNGLGIDLEHSQMFKMFQRFHDHVEGTGVGLHLINEMVESSGGHIEVESTVNLGSTFKVFLKNGQ